ncbi:MAG: chorismate mutase [Candidatus Gracilibacteria bacterium]|nr:chorismate mutase [Candidatus Gracilibacteria bacterium]
MNDLQKYREEIDSIDKDLIELLAKRFDVVKRVGYYKKEHNMPPLQAGRWQEVLDSRKNIASHLGVSDEFIEKVWNIIHDYALDLEK